MICFLLITYCRRSTFTSVFKEVTKLKKSKFFHEFFCLLTERSASRSGSGRPKNITSFFYYSKILTGFFTILRSWVKSEFGWIPNNDPDLPHTEHLSYLGWTMGAVTKSKPAIVQAWKERAIRDSLKNSVVDDPDSTHHPYADPNPDSDFYLMRIRMRIQVTTMMRIYADPQHC